jgi:hypothetical protein
MKDHRIHKPGVRSLAMSSRLGLAAVIIVACGAVAPIVQTTAAQTPAPSPESRVVQYWARRQAKDLAGAWTFYCAEYQARVPQPQFMMMTRLLRFDLRDITVAKVEPRADKADVTIAYKFSLPTMPGQDLDGQSSDVWSKGADGQWCKDDEPLVLPFPTSAPASQPGASPAPTTGVVPAAVPTPPPGVTKRP